MHTERHSQHTEDRRERAEDGRQHTEKQRDIDEHTPHSPDKKSKN
jgi:hypothetical protein